mmetsp:Transcript_5560/g.13508  ORF Transcript_5560/g.13508 Transcript_5560/m.13508 type:complete len:95 (-) Transcript_5560:40-324(-)
MAGPGPAGQRRRVDRQGRAAAGQAGLVETLAPGAAGLTPAWGLPGGGAAPTVGNNRFPVQRDPSMVRPSRAPLGATSRTLPPSALLQRLRWSLH